MSAGGAAGQPDLHGDDTACTPCEQIVLTKRLEAEAASVDYARKEESAATESERATVAALLTAQRAAEDELNKLYHQTVADVVEGSIDRSRDSAKFVQTAAAAVLAIYTGLLALVFSVTDNPLPVRGVWSGVFLGVSVALATAYLSYAKRPAPLAVSLSAASLVQLQHARTATLAAWIAQIVGTKRYAIRTSVLALGVGAALMIAPFVGAAAPVKLPAAPTAPTIPAAVAPGLASSAAQLFAAQVRDYTSSVAARAAVLRQVESAAKTRDSHEHRLNAMFALLALVGAVLVGAGPWVLDRFAG